MFWNYSGGAEQTRILMPLKYYMGVLQSGVKIA